MVDALLVLVVFLLVEFDVPGECGCRKDMQVPGARNATELIDAPLVVVTRTTILVDGARVGDPAAIDATRRVQRIDELFNVLRAKRETAKLLRPGRPPPTGVVLAMDPETSSAVFKSVVETAVFSGLSDLSFMVIKPG
jgi:hypothetical protein